MSWANPRYTACTLDEDMVGKIKPLAHMSKIVLNPLFFTEQCSYQIGGSKEAVCQLTSQNLGTPSHAAVHDNGELALDWTGGPHQVKMIRFTVCARGGWA